MHLFSLSAKALYVLLCSYTVTIHMTEMDRNPLNPSVETPHQGACSGVFISDTDILTARHCLDKATKVFIKTIDNQSFSAEIIKVDPVADLGLIRVTKLPGHKHAVIGNNPEITDSVYSVNMGDDYRYNYGEGIVENYVYLEDEGEGPKLILDSIAILPGASGSGLFDGKGKLVGISVRSGRVNSLAVSLEAIQEFLPH